jgi:hypothetical protein
VTLFSITYRMAFAHRNSNTGMLSNTRRLPTEPTHGKQVIRRFLTNYLCTTSAMMPS